MLHQETSATKPLKIIGTMGTKIDGVTYFSATEVTREIGISRQTLWRWRQEGKIPAGHRYRDRKILFMTHEVEIIRRFANRLEPIEQADFNQPSLFDEQRLGS